MSKLPHEIAKAAADAMAQQLRANGELLQVDAVDEIVSKFGEVCVYENDAGNLAIHRDILSEFRKMTDPDFVWDRGEKLWRRREEYDPVGTRQVE
jgi:uncharacterized protein DUF6953